MKNYKIVLFLIALLVVTGCSNNYKMEKVTEAFPNAEIVFTPNQTQDFIVREQDGSVWYVRCDNPFTGNVTSKSKILPANK